MPIRLLFLSLLLMGCSERMVDHTYPLTNGETVNFRSPEKLLVINYWATWCAPCRREVPELNELQYEYRDSLRVIGVNFDGSQGDNLLAEMDKLGMEFANFLQDPRQIWGLEPVEVLPETLIISTDGKLLHRLLGPQNKASLAALIFD